MRTVPRPFAFFLAKGWEAGNLLGAPGLEFETWDSNN
jgi:hypothetical protein